MCNTEDMSQHRQCWCAWDEADSVTHDEHIEQNAMSPHEPFSNWEDTLNKYGDDSRYEFTFRGVFGGGHQAEDDEPEEDGPEEDGPEEEGPEYEGPLLVVYMPWCVSGEVAESAPGHEDEPAWAVVELGEYEGFEVIEEGMTYEQAEYYLENGDLSPLAELIAEAESTDDYQQRERLIDEMAPLIRAQISQA